MRTHVVRGPEQLAQVAKLVSQLSPDKPWRIQIGPHRSKRSGEQNDRFHALVAEVAKETGNDPGWLKEWAKREFGPFVTMMIGEFQVSVPKPSSQYDTAEMSDVMERFSAWAASELGIMV